MQVLHNLKNMQNKLFCKIYLCILLCALFACSYGLASKSFSNFGEFNKLRHGRVGSAQVFSLKIPVMENDECFLDEKYAKKQYDLGMECLAKGIKKHNQAFIFFKKAADLGYAQAIDKLSDCYKKGIGVAPDPDQAVMLAQLADLHTKANEDVHAKFRLGSYYRDGVNGAVKNFEIARMLFAAAANQNHAEAQTWLGIFYMFGLGGLSKNPEQAFGLFQLAANQGNAHAQCNLGICYEEGIGVDPDSDRAFYYYKLAADLGDVIAQYNLGYCYKHGIGTEANFKLSSYYYRLAVDQEYNKACCGVGSRHVSCTSLVTKHHRMDRCGAINTDTKRLARIDAEKLIEVYGCSGDNWGDRPPFAGDYINYGYWENIALGNDVLFSIENRIESSRDLYKEITKRLNVSTDDVVLEIGCGRGAGIIDFLSSHQVKRMIGVDLNDDQIKRARKICADRVQDVQLVCRSAENTLFESHSIDKIYSVEVAQHFSSMFDFACEMKRLLKPGGKLVFASYFLVDNKYGLGLEGLFPLIQERLENIISCNEVRECFLKAGFKNISCESIGKHVFFGYERWIRQQESQQKNVADFSHDYFKAYEKGYIDYYIFTVSV